MPAAMSPSRQNDVAQEKLFTLRRRPKHFVEIPLPSSAASRPRKEGKNLPYSTFILVLPTENVIPADFCRHSYFIYV